MHELCLSFLQNLKAPELKYDFGEHKVPLPVNVVNTVYLNHPQDLKELAYLLPNAIFRNGFTSVHLKCAHPRALLMLFATGALIAVGANSEHKARYALQRQRYQLLAMGRRAAFHNPHVCNIVACSNIGYWVNIAQMSADISQKFGYSPKDFSGCTYRPRLKGIENAAIIIFEEDCRFNVMGVRSMDEVARLAQHMYAMMPKYKTTERVKRTNIQAVREKEKLTEHKKLMQSLTQELVGEEASVYKEAGLLFY